VAFILCYLYCVISASTNNKVYPKYLGKLTHSGLDYLSLRIKFRKLVPARIDHKRSFFTFTRILVYSVKINV
jgi:hypothetical protein